MVLFDEEFTAELSTMDALVDDEVLVLSGLLRQFGPQLGRPYCDTLKGSRHANMKELRFSVRDGEWRIAFAFDRDRNAILLAGGSKSGVARRRFHKDLIRVADARFDRHLLKMLSRQGG